MAWCFLVGTLLAGLFSPVKGQETAKEFSIVEVVVYGHVQDFKGFDEGDVYRDLAKEMGNFWTKEHALRCERIVVASHSNGEIASAIDKFVYPLVKTALETHLGFETKGAKVVDEGDWIPSSGASPRAPTLHQRSG